MKKGQTSKEAIKIFEAIEDRLWALWDKLVAGNYNAFTPFAYGMGFTYDIDNCLKKLKVKRTIVKQDNVDVIEMKDTEKLLNPDTKKKKSKRKKK